MKKKKKKKRSKGGKLSHIIYSYKYLRDELLKKNDLNSIFNLETGGKNKRLKLPKGKLRAFIRNLNYLLDYTDEKNNQAERKLWTQHYVKDQEYDERNVRFRIKTEHYAILEYISRNYSGVRLNESVLTVLSEKLDIPYYIIFYTYRSWVAYKHGRLRNPKDKQYMSDAEINSLIHEYDKTIIHELFG